MCFPFVPGFALGLLLVVTPILTLRTVTFDNNYAIFRAPDNRTRFDLDKYMEILFLNKREKPTQEGSLYWLKIQHNVSKPHDFLSFSMHKEGRPVHSNGHIVENESSLKDMEVIWNPSGEFQVTIKPTEYRLVVFSWVDDHRKDIPVNISHIAVKMSKSSTFRQRDSFMWTSNLFEACPYQNAIFSCELKINKMDGELAPKENRDKNVTKSTLSQIMEMKLLPSDPSKSANSYEVNVGLKTMDKASPRLFIEKNNANLVKMDTIFGCIDLDVNISADSISVFKKNDSLPLFFWREPGGNGYSAFRDLQYVSVQIVESSTLTACSASGTGRAFVNSCKITCNPRKEKSFIGRWWDNVKKVFSKPDTTPPTQN